MRSSGEFLNAPISPYFLFVFRASPYGTSASKEGIDAALASSVFELPIKLLFMNDGVFQLMIGQAPTCTNSVEKQLKALSLYGIDEIYIHEPSVLRRSIPLKNLQHREIMISSEGVSSLLSSATHIVSF